MTQFIDLGLAAPILKALGEEGYAVPTPIQAAAIPHIITGRDLVGIAQTGTGKTAAFALPILNRLANDPRRPARNACRVLVLSPTRELSAQILDSFRRYGRHLGLSSALVIGGVPIERQARTIAPGIDILVATPGRLQDLMNRFRFRLDDVDTLVLDEADRMLDMGFIHAIKAICSKLPAERLSLLFSATMPPAIASLAEQFLRNPARVSVTPPAATADAIDQRVIMLDRGAKPTALAELLHQPEVRRALVFTRTKHGADRVVRGLEKAGITAEAIHGNKAQGQRERALGGFRNGRLRVLVATDIAARGIDVDDISHVINFDLPNIAETYVHRIGRTARAGSSGTAISFCSDADERGYLRDIETLIRRRIPTSQRNGAERPSAPPAPAPRPSQPAAEVRPDRRGHRPAKGRNKSAATAARGAGDNLGGLSFLRQPVRSGDRPNRGSRPHHERKTGNDR